MVEGPMSQPANGPSAPPPSPVDGGLRSLFVVRSAPRRWPSGVRAAVCMGAPVLVGWLVGDLTAGLLATLGAFTALYGSGRPYFNRAGLLAVIALSLSAAVGLGIWAAAITWVGVLTVAAIASIATLLCNALDVGPPGAYQFALVCAIGTGLYGQHHDPVLIALLALAGGAFAWLVHMTGALLGPRRPEKSAVAAVGVAVADYIDAVGTDRQDDARHRAAQAIHNAWTTVVGRQPRHIRVSSTVRRLQDLNVQLSVLFADAIRCASTNTAVNPQAAAAARSLSRQAWARPGSGEASPAGRVLLARPSRWVLLKQDLQPGSRSRVVVARVAVATVLAGTVGGLLGLQHAYWAMAAAVVLLHQGLDHRRTIQRCLQRLLGTWLGLGLAAAVIAAHPHALWLVAAILVLNFLVEVTVVRNYTLAVVFITAVALLIATEGRSNIDPGAMLLARGLDTAVGCAVAVTVFLLMPTGVATWLPTAMADAVDAVTTTIGYLSPAQIATPAARAARRDLQRCALRLHQSFDNAINGSPTQRKAAEHAWPAMAATQQLIYRTIAECWRLEGISSGDDTEAQPPGPTADPRPLLTAMAQSLRAGDTPPS